MTRLGIALTLNQLFVNIFSTVLSIINQALVLKFGQNDTTDAAMLLLKCVAYFAAFTLPILAFNLMCKNMDREEYPVVDNNKKSSPLDLACTVIVGLGLIDVFSIVNYHAVKLILPHYSEYTNKNFWAAELDENYQVIIYFIYVAVIPAIVEELLFRKTACDALAPYRKGTAVLFSALFFSLMHSNIEQLLYTFVAGIFLSLLYVNGKSILLPILLHFLNNGRSALLTILRERAQGPVYTKVSFIMDISVLFLSAAALIYWLLKILKSGKLSKKTEEEIDIQEVIPLTKKEKARGFLSFGMIIYVAYCLLTAGIYIYKSLVQI
jgi:membrane protease YdiL (CAAX protease family)